MPRIAGSSCPAETEGRMKDFLADIRALAEGSMVDSADRQGRRLKRCGPPAMCVAGYEQDRGLYERALDAGLGLAGMVAFSVDGMGG